MYDERAAYSTRVQDYRNMASFAATLRQDDPSKDVKYLDEQRKSRKANKSVDQIPKPAVKEQHTDLMVQDKVGKEPEDGVDLVLDDVLSIPSGHDKQSEEKDDQLENIENEKLVEVNEEELAESHPTVEDKIKQLHVFINIPGTPANRIFVFFNHMRGRTKPAEGQEQVKGAAVSIQGKAGKGLEIVDLSTIKDNKLEVGIPENKRDEPAVEETDLEKAKEQLEKQKAEKEKRDQKMIAQVQGGLIKYKRTIEKFVLPEEGEEGREYDEMVVIGVAHPETKSKEGMKYKAYQSLSGLTNIKEVASQLNILANRCVKDDGIIRIQLCHAKSIGQGGSDSFVEQIMSSKDASERRINISAPESFSIIGSNGAAVDVTTHASIFENELKGRLAKLMNNEKFQLLPLKEKKEEINMEILKIRGASQVDLNQVFYREPDELRQRGMFEDL